MTAHTAKSYAVADDVWRHIRDAGLHTGMTEFRPILNCVLAFIAIAGAGVFLSMPGVISPNIGIVVPNTGYWDHLTHKLSYDFEVRNKGLAVITIDGPGKLDVPGVVVDRVTTLHPIPGIPIGDLYETGDNRRGEPGQILVELTVTSCDTFTEYVDSLRNGKRTVAFPLKLTVPVRTSRGTRDVLIEDHDQHLRFLGEAIGKTCSIDLDNLPRKTTRSAPLAPSQVPGEFVTISPETFIMGSKPTRTVTITAAFEMAKYEVTQAQWWAVMGTEPSVFEGDNLPVERVRWSMAQEFLKRLNERNDGYRYRLPTGKEWEYAARAGSTVEPDADAVAWNRNNSNQTTHPVGMKAPNAWGLYDMQGNVREWVEDGVDDPSVELSSDRLKSFGSKFKDSRGCTFASNQLDCQISYRSGPLPAEGTLPATGFRLVREKLTDRRTGTLLPPH